MKRSWQVTPVLDDSIEYEWEGWNVKATWPRRGGRTEVIVTMQVRFTGMNGGLVMSRKRVNIMSASATNSIVTDMNRLEAHPRTELMFFLNDVCENILYWYEQGKTTEFPDPGKVRDHVPWMVYPVWPAAGVTGIAAAPGTYKSFMAQAISLELAAKATVLSRNTKVMNSARVLYLDWEADSDTFARRLAALSKGAGLEVKPWLGYKHMTARLSDVALGLRETIVAEEWDAVVVDSMSAGIGAGMVDDDAVNGFYDAIHMLDVPALVLAHKSVENIRKKQARFFGSGMSEARVRMAWNAEVSADETYVVWDCFKDNNHGKKGSKLAWEIDINTSGADEETRMDTVTFLGVNPGQVSLDDPNGSVGPSMSDRIEAYLERTGDWFTPQEIADHLGAKHESLRVTVTKMTPKVLQRRQRTGSRGYEYAHQSTVTTGVTDSAALPDPY